MLITFYDSSYLKCNKIEIYDNDLIIDEYRIVPICEVNSIESE